MKSKKNIVLLVVAVILVLALGIYLFTSNLTDWNYSLDKDKKTPYGTYLTNRLLKNKYGTNYIEIKNSVLETFRKLDRNKRYNYVYINNEAYYDTAVVDTLMKFAAAGNTVFLAVEDITGYFRDCILSKQYHLGLNFGYNYDDENAFTPPDTTTYSEVVEEYDEDEENSDDEYADEEYVEEDTSDVYYDSTYVETDSVQFIESDTSELKEENIFSMLNHYKDMEDTIALNFTHPDFKSSKDYVYFKKYKADTIPIHNTYFIALNDSFHNYPLHPDDAISFSGFLTNDGEKEMNMVILKHGKGNVIIILTAMPFTNYFMRTPKGLDFVEKTLAHLPHANLIWDDVSHIYDEEDYHGSAELNGSPLYFILKNTQLRWAWYLTLLALIIYAIFRAKRRQEIIPIIEPKQNTSLQYVETIGQLYFHESEHIEIAVEMRNQLLNYIRTKYNLKTNELDDAFFSLLSLKSGIEDEKLRALFQEYVDVSKLKSIDNAKLSELNNKTEYFYKHCK